MEEVAFWRETAVSETELQDWLAKQGEKIESVDWQLRQNGSVFCVEYVAAFKDGKRQLKRLMVEGQPAEDWPRTLIAGLPSSGSIS